MPENVIRLQEEKMNKTIDALKNELVTIRAGRANPAMLDRISIDYYGAITPIKQLASVTAPEPRLITIQPYDTSILNLIDKAIQQSDLGINPSNDGKLIRLNIPQLTEERRRDLIKIVKRTAEDSKIALRNERRNSNDALKKLHKDNELTEDELKIYLEKVQDTTDKFIKIVDELASKKENEVMEV
ncbi:ribosome recycling factor [Serpentinicella sp. ANB-PHB4]|uniref:ribosome recycling factor n=1 Tax=Serpentinicella sp. ANB-PHB4 TaxID=3074076 RepID=UPI002856BB81|nr:ribosome recycling factor [Serpentinicella sp. ANB-PHB4]MDR5658233.1 ribosome recycling factor [Serpentinicella sp. ANB-PHB4]